MDASSVALGAVLSQQEDPSQPLQPCTFSSQQFTPLEHNDTIWEPEFLAIKTAFEVWGHYLKGAYHPVLVLMDYLNREYLQTAWRLNQRQIRWCLFFSWFDFCIIYILHTQNRKADALSHKPEYVVPTSKESPITPILSPSVFAATTTCSSLAEEIQASRAQDPGPSNFCRNSKRALPGSPIT